MSSVTPLFCAFFLHRPQRRCSFPSLICPSKCMTRLSIRSTHPLTPLLTFFALHDLHFSCSSLTPIGRFLLHLHLRVPVLQGISVVFGTRRTISRDRSASSRVTPGSIPCAVGNTQIALSALYHVRRFAVTLRFPRDIHGAAFKVWGFHSFITSTRPSRQSLSRRFVFSFTSHRMPILNCISTGMATMSWALSILWSCVICYRDQSSLQTSS